MFPSISPGFILRTIASRVGEAANVLNLGNIAVVFKESRFFATETNLSGCHCNTYWGGGWLMDQKEAAFWGGLTGPSADRGSPLVDARTFEDEGLWKIQK